MEEKFGFRTMAAPPPLRQEEDKDKVQKEVKIINITIIIILITIFIIILIIIRIIILYSLNIKVISGKPGNQTRLFLFSHSQVSQYQAGV